jgi:hypothetical protein
LAINLLVAVQDKMKRLKNLPLLYMQEPESPHQMLLLPGNQFHQSLKYPMTVSAFLGRKLSNL